MREQTLRASSSHNERAEYRPNQGGKSKSSGVRSRRSTNLGRLSKELGSDLLGAALGLSTEAVSILVDGRDHAREQQYAAHLAARFEDAGIPAAWLDTQGSLVLPEYLRVLRQFAAASNNKPPIRRANFRRLAAAFLNREEVLADALEMVASAVSNVSEGLLELDDFRFGHINPRLMRAGFPDGWLEQAEPDLTDAMLLSLEHLATDEYERKFEEEDSSAHAGQVFVSPPLAPENKTMPQPEAAPVEQSKETNMSPPRQAKAPEMPRQPSEFKGGGLPNAPKAMAHPSAGGARLPRSVMAAGRKVTSTPAAKPLATNATKTTSKTGTPPPKMTQQAAPGSAPSSTPPPSPTPNASAAPSPTAGAASQPAAPEARRTLAPRGTVSKEVSLARAEALEQLLEKSRRGAKVTLWRDLLGSSLPFWGNIRRGAVLFRDDLAEGVVEAMGLPEGWLDKPSYPPATMSAWVTDKDAPVPQPVRKFGENSDEGSPQANQSAAVAEPASAPASGAKTGAASKRDASKPFARTTAPRPPKVTMTQMPPSAPPVFPGAPAPAASGTPAVDNTAEGRQLELADMGAPVAGTSLAPAAGVPAPAQELTEAQAPAAAPAPALSPAPAVAASNALAPVVAAPTGGAASGQLGPLTLALMSIITAKSTAGTFSETDALSLINKLMTS